MTEGGRSLDSGPCLKLRLGLHHGVAAHRQLEGPAETGYPEQLCWAVPAVLTEDPQEPF